MAVPTSSSEFVTLTEITQMIFGRALRQDRARTAYAVEAFGIAPARKVGTVRLWSRDSVPLIRGALARIGCRTGNSPRGT